MRNRIHGIRGVVCVYQWLLKSIRFLKFAELFSKIECEQAAFIKNIYEYIILISFAIQKNLKASQKKFVQRLVIINV